MKIKSRVFDEPEEFSRVPKFIFWMKWCWSQISKSERSMFDSWLFPSGQMPIPWHQEALGKLKSPARMISGRGV